MYLSFHKCVLFAVGHASVGPTGQQGVPEGQNLRQVHHTRQFSKSLSHTCDEAIINGLIHTEKERHKVPRLSGPEEQPQLAPQPVLLPLKQRR